MSQADLLARLEAVTTRLERAAARMGGSGGSGDDDDDVPGYVSELQTIVQTKLGAVVDACTALGITPCSNALKAGYDNVLDLVSRVPKAKKPSQQELLAFLKPAVDAIQAADNLKFKGKNFKDFGDHYKAIYESVNSCSWVTMAPPMGTPATHIEAQKDATNFNLIKIQRSKKDEKNQNFVKSLQALNNSMSEYAKQYFKKDGLVWNPKGAALSSASGAAAGGSSAPAAAEEKKEASPAKTTTTKKAGGAGGMAGVFGQLNKGLNVTSGLKKVKKEQKTKYRKDRSGKVEMKAPVKKAGRNKGPANIVFKGGRWMAENHNEGVFEIPEATTKTGVYLTMGDGATYNLQNQKVKSITIDSCNKCRVFVGEVVSTVEAVNCKGLTIVVTKSAPSIAIDKSQSPRIIITPEAFTNPPDIYTSNISAMNLEIPGATADADPIEIPIPEQFVTKIDTKNRSITTTEVTHG